MRCRDPSSLPYKLTLKQWFGDIILSLSPSYIRGRPDAFPADHHWPDKYEIVDSLGTIADLRWP